MANQSVTSGILTDYNGNPFLPRTTFSQVFDDSTGESLGEILELVQVPRGGTGSATHELNSVLVGNGTGILKHISSKSGAFYATAANGEPKFGTLPVAQGGTGITSNPSMLVNLGSTTADTVFEATPRPGVTGKLGIANGGTGATSLSANRMLFVSGTALTTSSHYVASGKLAVNSTSAPSGVFAVSGQSDFGGVVNLNGGHLYLNGAGATSNANTTQIIFKQGTTEHIALSSNDNAFIINPESNSNTNQIVLYTDNTKVSLLPGPLSIGSHFVTTGAISITGTGNNALLAFTSGAGSITTKSGTGLSLNGGAVADASGLMPANAGNMLGGLIEPWDALCVNSIYIPGEGTVPSRLEMWDENRLALYLDNSNYDGIIIDNSDRSIWLSSSSVKFGSGTTESFRIGIGGDGTSLTTYSQNNFISFIEGENPDHRLQLTSTTKISLNAPTVNFSGGIHLSGGHLHLNGCDADSSLASKTQIVFRNGTTQYLALSAKNNTLVLNPTSSNATNNIVLYLDQPSEFNSGLQVDHCCTMKGTGLILKNKVYGTLADMNAIAAPEEGQVFFVIG